LKNLLLSCSVWLNTCQLELGCYNYLSDSNSLLTLIDSTLTRIKEVILLFRDLLIGFK